MEIKKEKLVIKLSEEEKEAIKIIQGMGDYIYNNGYCRSKDCKDCPFNKWCGNTDIINEIEDFLNNDE